MAKQKFIKLNNVESIPNDIFGVYKLHYVNSKSITALPLTRLFKNDKEGVLYIGSTKTSTLRTRLKRLRYTILNPDKPAQHIAGENYNRVSIIKKKIPFHNLAVSYRITDYNQKMIEEKKEIASYKNEFGEVPPLNSY